MTDDNDGDRLRRTHWIETDDGQRLHAESSGAGPALVCANGLGCSTHYWKYLVPYFATAHQVTTWDYRGHGRSPAPAAGLDGVSVVRFAEDLRCVLGTVTAAPAVLIGHSLGCQILFELYKRHPERVAALILVLGTFGRPLATFWDNPWAARVFPLVHGALSRLPGPVGLFNRTFTRSPWSLALARRAGIIHPTLCRAEDMRGYFEHLAALDVRLFLRLARDAADHSAEDVLESTAVPVLIVGGEADVFTPVWLSHEMHERIPGSELLIVPEGSHAALLEQPELINLRIEKFMRERLARPGAATVPA